MNLPNQSKSMDMARTRYIQSVYEVPEHRNPDTLVRYLIPLMRRIYTALFSKKELFRLRTIPFYYYLIARTKYYDQVVHDAVADGAQKIVMIGCGSDTRAYRFSELLRNKGVKVLECDLPEAIYKKRRMAKRWRASDYVEYMAIDLNNDGWPELERWIGPRTGPRILVMMEGVSPYVNDKPFRRFLQFLAAKLPTGSHVAYDFKIRGVNDGFGSVGKTQSPFRLPQTPNEVATFHATQGLRLEHMELSSELRERLLPDLTGSAAPVFGEDGLVRLKVDQM